MWSTTAAGSVGDRARRAVEHLVTLEPGEWRRVALSFAYFFSVLCAYYIVRPIRETMSGALKQIDPHAVEHLFTVVFIVMLCAVPLMGYVTARFARQRIVPTIYTFFALCLGGFWFVLHDGPPDRLTASAFFVWVSVFNLFAISLFWSVMSDTYTSADAKRVFGVISAGGSIGGLVGSGLAALLAKTIGTANLLWFSMAALMLALASYQGLVRETRGTSADDRPPDAPVTLATLVAGAVRVLQNPLLTRIAICILLANIVSTFFYLQQTAIVVHHLPKPDDRTQLFAVMNLIQNIGTIAAEFFLTSRLIGFLGLGLAIAAVAALALGGLLGLAIWPSLAMIVTIIVAERIVGFALSNPAKRVLYTDVPPEDKYKSQNFIDTVVFRGGDAASGWLVAGLSRGLSLGPEAIAMVLSPLAALWAYMAYRLGREHDDRHPDTKSDH